jgi:hypothetical protein
MKRPVKSRVVKIMAFFRMAQNKKIVLFKPEDAVHTRALPWSHEGLALVTRGPCPGCTRVKPWFFRAVDIKVRHSGMLLARLRKSFRLRQRATA